MLFCRFAVLLENKEQEKLVNGKGKNSKENNG